MAEKKASRWEALCSQCGMCCHEKIIYGNDLIYDMGAPCEFLDTATNQCTVYAERFEKCPRCQKMTVWKAMTAAWLPESCSYVQWAHRHRISFAPRLNLVVTDGLLDDGPWDDGSEPDPCA